MENFIKILKKATTALLLIILAMTFGPLTAFAAWAQQDEASRPDGSSTYYYFGDTVDISGTTAIVGCYHANSSTGEAYIFELYGTDWNDPGHITHLTASDPSPVDSFGMSVAISGDYAVIGAPYHDTEGDTYINNGALYFFKKTGGVWAQDGNPVLGSNANNVNLGYSVDISGSYAVASEYNYTGPPPTPKAFAFERTGSNPNYWVNTHELVRSDGSTTDKYGKHVAISGDYALVTAPENDGAANNAGAVYVFERDPSTGWPDTQTQKLTASDAAAADFLGWGEIGISGTTAVIGAFGDDDHGDYSGSAYVFERVTGTWTQQQKLTATDGADYDYFGWSSSISGDNIIVGAQGESSSKGAVYVYTKSGTWPATETSKITAGDGVSNDEFGVSTSISGYYAIVGAPSKTVSSAGWAGAAYFLNTEAPAALPEFKDYTYALTLLLSLGLMYTVINKNNIKIQNTNK